MKLSIAFFTIIVALNLKFCGANETNNSNSETDKEIQINSDGQNSAENKNLLVLADLIKIIRNDKIDENSIYEYIKTINNDWKSEGTDDEEIIFTKNKDDTSKEMLSFHYKRNILEYITFDDDHFFRFIKDFEYQNFEITNTSQNEYGGNVSKFSDGKLLVITEEIPLTQTGKNAHKILIAQKR